MEISLSINGFTEDSNGYLILWGFRPTQMLLSIHVSCSVVGGVSTSAFTYMLFTRRYIFRPGFLTQHLQIGLAILTRFQIILLFVCYVVLSTSLCDLLPIDSFIFSSLIFMRIPIFFAHIGNLLPVDSVVFLPIFWNFLCDLFIVSFEPHWALPVNIRKQVIVKTFTCY